MAAVFIFPARGNSHSVVGSICRDPRRIAKSGLPRRSFSLDGFVKGDPALDWGLRGKAPAIKTSRKPAPQNRIPLAAIEPISHSATLSRLALIERSLRFSISISQQRNSAAKAGMPAKCQPGKVRGGSVAPFGPVQTGREYPASAPTGSRAG
jgi:hypothetical protein